MDRRGFFRSLAAMAGALALDPEQLLWTPTKTIFIPSSVSAVSYDELTAVVLMHIRPHLFDYIYNNTPIFSHIRRASQEQYEKATPLNFPIMYMDQNPMEIISDYDVRQIGDTIRERAGSPIDGSRGPEIHFPEDLYRSARRAMHSREAERPIGVVLSVSGA